VRVCRRSSLPEVRMSERLAFRDRVAEYLKDRPNRWVDGMSLAQVGGIYAWRSRVSDARRDLGMTIENRQRREKGTRGVISEYRYVPASLPQEQSFSFSEAREQ